MGIKLLTANRGPLQGVTLAAVVKSAYGPGASFQEDDDGDGGTIVTAGEVVDTVIEYHSA